MSDTIETTNELSTPTGDGEGLPTTEIEPSEGNLTTSEGPNSPSPGEEIRHNEQSDKETQNSSTDEVVGDDATETDTSEQSIPDDSLTGFQPPTPDELTDLGLDVKNELSFPFNLLDIEKYTDIFRERDMTKDEVGAIREDITNNLTKLLNSRKASESEITTTVGVISTAVDGYINMIGKAWETQRQQEQNLKEAEETYIQTLRSSTTPEQLEKAKTLLNSLNGQEQLKFNDFLLNDYKDNPELIDKLIAGDDVVDELETAIAAFKNNPNTLKNFLKDLAGPAQSKAALVDYAYKELGIKGTPPENPTDNDIKNIVNQIHKVKGTLSHLVNKSIPKGLLNKDIMDIINK